MSRQWYALLESWIQFSAEVPLDERQRMVREAVRHLASSERTNHNAVLNRIQELETEYLAQGPCPFVVLTSLPLAPSDGLRRRQVGPVSMSFLEANPRRFARDKELQRSLKREGLSPKKGWTTVLLRTTARTPSEAAERSMDALLLWRGIWNLILNSGRTEVSLGWPTPPNKVRPGPAFTVHHPQGQAASKAIWPDRSYWVGPQRSLALRSFSPDQIERLAKGESKVRREIRDSHYGPIIERSIRTYCLALDTINWEASLLSLWTVLEALTGERVRQRRRARRVAFLYPDPHFVEEVVYRFAQNRNAIAHTDEGLPGGQELVRLLMNYVEGLLLHHLLFRPRFTSLQQAVEFLDLPTTPNDLCEEHRKHTEALHSLKQASEYRASTAALLTKATQE